ncbi:MAG: tRNA (mnm(5)s(2)U34)-methyltransferase, partial [Halanaerobiales bacterium]
KLFCTGHENMESYIKRNLDGILFNLGYLPGGDRRIVTDADKTLKAVQVGLNLLKNGGLIVLVIYTGQAGGQQERDVLLYFSKTLDESVYNVMLYHFLNQKKEPPQVLAIKKRK